MSQKPGILSFDPEAIRQARAKRDATTEEPMPLELLESAQRIRDQRTRAAALPPVRSATEESAPERTTAPPMPVERLATGG